MIVYRLCKAAHIALDGEGARLWGGRWNSAGRPMIYTAASPSLAVLEVLVHLDLTPELLPDDYRLLSIAIPDATSLNLLDAASLDDAACLAAGDAFLDAGEALALRVSSVVVPQEWNMLLNPAHADMTQVTVITNDPFEFDPRLLG